MRSCPECGAIIDRAEEVCPRCGHRRTEGPRVREKPISDEEQKRLEEEKMQRVSKTEAKVMDFLLSVLPLVFPLTGALFGYFFGGVRWLIYGAIIGFIAGSFVQRL